MYRGCMSDSTDSRLQCDSNDPDQKSVCIKCGETGCNDIPTTKHPSLSCVHCKDSRDCVFGHAKESTYKCYYNVPFGSNESCYVRYNASM